MMETGGNETSGHNDAVFDDFDELVEVALSSVDDARKALAAHKAVQTAQAAHSAQDVNILPDARTSDDGTTISRTSDAKMLEAQGKAAAEAKAIAMAEAQAKAATEAKAMAIAEAQAKAKTIAEAQAKAATEDVAKEIAKEQAAHAAMAAAEVAKAISEAKDWFWIPEARETEATTAPPQLCNGERQRLFPPTLMFQQEPGDPPDVSVLSSKPKPQDSTQEVNIPSFETRFKETPDASVEDTGT